MKFSALAGNGMQRVSSDAAAVLFFLQKRKKRMGRKSGGQGRPPLHGAAKTKRGVYCCPLTGVTTLAGDTRLVFQAPAGFSIGV